jgi:hypothetical protein
VRVYRTRPVADRFWEKVDKCGPVPPNRKKLGRCWVWTAAKAYGYGVFCLSEERQSERAHRVSWLLTHGRWPNQWGLHKCDNKACVRPSHLFEGNNALNIADCIAKGRVARGERNNHAKITAQTVIRIRKLASSGATQRSIAARLGLSATLVSNVVLRRTWKHVP